MNSDFICLFRINKFLSAIKKTIRKLILLSKFKIIKNHETLKNYAFKYYFVFKKKKVKISINKKNTFFNLIKVYNEPGSRTRIKNFIIRYRLANPCYLKIFDQIQKPDHDVVLDPNLIKFNRMKF